MVNIDKIKQLRQGTGVSISECQKALENAGGNIEKAKKILKEKGQKFLEKKSQRETKEGIIDSYIHPDKKVGVLLELNCESDFVARSKDFQTLAHELCLQIAAMDSQENTLMSEPWIKDESKTIQDLIKEYIMKLGENIVVSRFARYDIK